MKQIDENDFKLFSNHLNLKTPLDKLKKVRNYSKREVNTKRVKDGFTWQRRLFFFINSLFFHLLLSYYDAILFRVDSNFLPGWFYILFSYISLCYK